MIHSVTLTKSEWDVLLSGVQDSLRHFDVYNSHLSKIYQEIQFQLEDED